MSLEENKAVIHGLYEAYNKHYVALLDEFIAPDYVHHAQKLRGLESVKEYEAMIYKGFPDLHDTI
jgi:predicted ester cyclase